MSAHRERLRRLLLAVPLVKRHPGISLQELALRLDEPVPQLRHDLGLLGHVGRPPFAPDDLIELHVASDRVFPMLTPCLSKVPALTLAETAALLLAIPPAPKRASAGLEEARRKLLEALPLDARDACARIARQVRATHPAFSSGLQADLERAVAEHWEIDIDYLALGQPASLWRRVRPWELWRRQGALYLSAFCLLRREARLFRADRIRALRFTQKRFGRRRAPPPSAEAKPALLRFDAELALWAQERFGGQARLEPDGSCLVALREASHAWLTAFVLAMGGRAALLEPEPWRQDIARAAALLASRLPAPNAPEASPPLG